MPHRPAPPVQPSLASRANKKYKSRTFHSLLLILSNSLFQQLICMHSGHRDHNPCFFSSPLKKSFTTTNNLNTKVISYKFFPTERDKCVRGGHIPGCAQERATALRTREERARHRNSLSEGRAASTACPWPALYRSSSAIQLPGESLKWELKGTDLPVRHCTEKQQLKRHTTAETKPKEEQIERSTGKQFEALSEEFFHHGAGKSGCCG